MGGMSAGPTTEVVDDFHRLYYRLGEEGGTWNSTHWMGVRVQKCPLDLWVYQELIHRTQPELIIETGTAWGGSAYYYAHLYDLMQCPGQIVTVDIEPLPDRPVHRRVTYLAGSSTAPEIVEQLTGLARAARSVMVILDSDHSARHVTDELRCYAELVTPGCYLIVEDSNANGHPVLPDYGPGPMEAIDAWLATDPPFDHDPHCERLLLSFNPRGYYRRRG